MNFFKNIISSAIGVIMAFGLIFVFGLVIAIVIGSDGTPQVKKDSFLTVTLRTPIKDYAPIEMDPLSQLLGLPPKYIGVNSIVNAISKAKEDADIKGLSIEVSSIAGGISQLFAIQKAIEDFKSSGKPVYAFSDTFGQQEYFFSTVADSIFVSPVGGVDLKGLSTELLFFKDFQDKYGVKMEVIRHGKYKSAVEPFLDNKMSESNRIQLSELLHSLWGDITAGISKSRGIELEKLNKIADELGGRTAELALQNNLIDGMLYIDEYETKIKEDCNLEDYKSTSLEDYITATTIVIPEGLEQEDGRSKIAVVYAQGEIIYGEGDEEVIGQGLMVRSLDAAADDENVKAIVLRVNSPGGSALASDLIWNAIEKAKEKKPVVVSMGDYAASGGYYISCNADKIFAESTTITGSIGVFGILPNASELTDKMGIHAERISTNTSPSYSPFSQLDPAFYEVTKESIDLIYRTFVLKVAAGRGKTYDEIHALAQGRVWSGTQAIENGLIDEIGGIDAAIKAASDIAEVNDYKIVNYPKYDEDIRETLRGFPFASIEQSFLKEWLGDENFKLLSQLKAIQSKEGVQMRMPFVLEIE